MPHVNATKPAAIPVVSAVEPSASSYLTAGIEGTGTDAGGVAGVEGVLPVETTAAAGFGLARTEAAATEPAATAAAPAVTAAGLITVVPLAEDVAGVETEVFAPEILPTGLAAPMPGKVGLTVMRAVSLGGWPLTGEVPDLVLPPLGAGEGVVTEGFKGDGATGSTGRVVAPDAIGLTGIIGVTPPGDGAPAAPGITGMMGLIGAGPPGVSGLAPRITGITGLTSGVPVAATEGMLGFTTGTAPGTGGPGLTGVG